MFIIWRLIFIVRSRIGTTMRFISFCIAKSHIFARSFSWRVIIALSWAIMGFFRSCWIVSIFSRRSVKSVKNIIGKFIRRLFPRRIRFTSTSTFILVNIAGGYSRILIERASMIFIFPLTLTFAFTISNISLRIASVFVFRKIFSIDSSIWSLLNELFTLFLQMVLFFGKSILFWKSEWLFGWGFIQNMVNIVRITMSVRHLSSFICFNYKTEYYIRWIALNCIWLSEIIFFYFLTFFCLITDAKNTYSAQ